MASGSITHEAYNRVQSDMNRLTVVQLKSVVRNEGIPVSGTKGALQDRIKTRLDECFKSNDVVGFQRVRGLISEAARSSSTGAFANLSSASFEPRMGPAPAAPAASFTGSPNAQGQVRLNFRDSPFYEVERPLTKVEQTKVVDSSRGNFELKIKIPPDVASRFSKENPHRDRSKVMVFCAAEPISSYVKLDVAFPNQIELRVNGSEFKSNLRGLKNKPGSTRPADITDLLRKSPNYENTITAAYALTTKKFYFVVNLVNYTPVEDLVRRLREGKPITKEQVRREMISKAQDNELEAISSRMSLKCPLSTLRMETPCRSTRCSHNQCFDGLSFLQLQQQAPTWTCPVCNKIFSFEALQVDEYVNDILKLTPHGVEQVSINPNGQWEIVDPGDSRGRPSHTQESSGDDELIEIPDAVTERGLLGHETSAMLNSMRTPKQISREQSVSSSIARSSNGKRQHSAVIDLTVSDEEDEPVRPPKRSAVNNIRTTFQSAHGAHNTTPSSDSRQSTLSFSIPKPSTGRPPTMEYGFPGR